MEKELLRAKIENLVGIEKRLYDLLPDECWLTEESIAERLSSRRNKVGRTKARNLKWSLINQGILKLEELPNGKRKNPKHKLWKAYPIILCDEGESYFRYDLEDDYEIDTYDREVDWELLQQYTAEEINNMDKLEKIDLYLEAGLIVLPTAYPVFTPNGVECSCKKGSKCPSIGKHPVVAYKYIDGYNYDKLRSRYEKQFKSNPDLNIGFKVMGYSVLDVDYRSGGDLSLADLKHNFDVTMKGVMSVASGNGMHIYANNKYLKNTANVIGDGLDIRSQNGFIMGAGSVHKSGATYKWNEIGEPADIPEDWIEVAEEEVEEENLRGKKGNNPTNITLKDIKLPKRVYPEYVIPKGERELTLFKWACRERGNGADELLLCDILTTIRDTYCEESETVADEEIKDIAESVVKSYVPNRDKKRR